MTAPPPHTQNQSENSRSIQLARKHCDNPSWIYIDTTPFYAMVRFSGGRLKHIETCKNMMYYFCIRTNSNLAKRYQLSSFIAGSALGLASNILKTLSVWISVFLLLLQEQRWALPFPFHPFIPSSLLQHHAALRFLVYILKKIRCHQ